MKELKEKIQEEIKELENMIKSNKNKEEVEKQRKKLDKLLVQYLKDL